MVYSYTAIGDSLTVGFGALPGNGFVPVYRGMAEQHVREFVAYENFGVNGLTTSGLYEHISRNGAMRQAIKQAEIITISIGGNDLIRAAKSAPFGSKASQHFNQALSQCKTNVSGVLRTINQLKGGGQRPYIIRAVGLYNPYPQVEEAGYWVQQYNRFLNGYAGGNLGVANIYGSFQGRERELLSLDHLHPNGRGYRVIAEQLNALGYRPLA
ncbi:GDSL-type esterase/lipase family protein [Paenibacillus cellulositrophicus]|nr:GDSL-type esterase/lipase family protein [Paenibacillus cellulositrophicus]MCM2997300.1 GDSL-type esterase/lipase family protein [Paenibacillus cellulositrophicus]